MSKPSLRNLAFTLLELLVLLATLSILSVLVIPALARTVPSVSRLNCAANLKQIGIAFQNWRNAHLGLYPMTVPNYAAGPPLGGITLSAQAQTYSLPGAGPYLYTAFGVMSNELSTTKILTCPTDERTPHSNFVMRVTGLVGSQQALGSAANSPADNDPPYFNNFKVSYFLGINATDLHSQMLLAGDRNIWGDRTASITQPAWNNEGYGNINSYEYSMGTNWVNGSLWPQWSPSKMHQGKGNALIADGSVQQLDSPRFRQQVRISGDTTTIPGPNVLLFL